MQDQVALVQVDLAKAFYRMSHHFLFKQLDRVNAGAVVLYSVSLLSWQFRPTHCTEDSEDTRIPLVSSVKQEIPRVSLFSLYTESLWRSIISSASLIGHQLLSVQVKVLAYADDVAFFCTGKRNDYNALMFMEEFCPQVGAIINKSVVSSGLDAGAPNLFNIRESLEPARLG